MWASDELSEADGTTRLKGSTMPTQLTQIMESIDNLPALVRDRFDAARASGALIFYQTQVSILRYHDIPVNAILG